VKRRGEVPGVLETVTTGTPREVSGVVHGIYFLEKMNRYPGPNKQSLVLVRQLPNICTQRPGGTPLGFSECTALSGWEESLLYH
jgi:hypothetical protein